MKTQTLFLLLAFMLVGNVLIAQSKYDYASTMSTEGDNMKYAWVVIEGGSDEAKMDKLEVQTVNKTAFSASVQGLIKQFERRG